MIPDTFSRMILKIDFPTRLNGGRAENFSFVHGMLNTSTPTDSGLGYHKTWFESCLFKYETSKSMSAIN